ncbi:hypothetical protein VOLCADRAFT_55328, partial [Volvox carteri f. nagariensis]
DDAMPCRDQAEADATHGVALANIFVDAPYNRTGFTLVSTQADRLTAAIVRLSRAALQLRDLRSHVATHPRLGIVDHISLHPLGSLSESAVAATAVAGQKPLEPAPALPVYLYGFAHPSRRCLSEVRRQLGSNGNGTYQPQPQPPPLPDPDDLLRFPPDLGPSEPPPQSGLVTIGAVPWVVNYNVPLQDVDLAEAKWLARAVSERGGGLPGVEAMALKHADDTVEVACNLLDETLSSPHAVQARLEALASSRGLDQWAVLWGYRTNKSPEELLHAAAAALAAKAAEQRRRGG